MSVDCGTMPDVRAIKSPAGDGRPIASFVDGLAGIRVCTCSPGGTAMPDIALHLNDRLPHARRSWCHAPVGPCGKPQGTECPLRPGFLHHSWELTEKP